MKLLVISPHPDDEVEVAGLIGKAEEVLILYMSIGDSKQLVTGQTRRIDRLKEIEEVFKLTNATIDVMYIGGKHVCLDAIPLKEIVENLDDVIEEFKPDTIAIPSSSSYNQDHRTTFDACMAALRPTPRSVRHYVNTVIEYFEPYIWNARPAKQPNVYLDLSQKLGEGTLLDFKKKLYRCHKTQIREDPHARSIENLERIAHIYGKEAGIEIAEAYHLLRFNL